MFQEPFLYLADLKLTTVVTAQAIRCSPNGEQRLQRPAIFRPLKDEIIAPHMARIPRFRYFPTVDTVLMKQLCDLSVAPVVVPLCQSLGTFQYQHPGAPAATNRSLC